MDANSGEPWSEADISDLKNELDHGRTIAETASFLLPDVFNQADLNIGPENPQPHH